MRARVSRDRSIPARVHARRREKATLSGIFTDIRFHDPPPTLISARRAKFKRDQLSVVNTFRGPETRIHVVSFSRLDEMLIYFFQNVVLWSIRFGIPFYEGQCVN